MSIDYIIRSCSVEGTQNMIGLTNRPRTPDEVRAEIERRGKTIREVAQEIGVNERIVYEVLRGRFKGRRGQAHKAAVLLGLKAGIVE